MRATKGLQVAELSLRHRHSPITPYNGRNKDHVTEKHSMGPARTGDGGGVE